jgi:hypothetical protein
LDANTRATDYLVNHLRDRSGTVAFSQAIEAPVSISFVPTVRAAELILCVEKMGCVSVGHLLPCMLQPRGLCVDKMGYVSVGHLLPWISPKYVALKSVVYSL